jgi:peptidoglycan-associated lipoprotein
VPPPVPVASPVSVDPLTSMAVDDVNRASLLKPVFYLYDSDQLDDAARQTLSENSQVLRKYASWVVTVEGHCDERGSAEYNLALGDRRAQTARNYLVSLGVPADRVRTVSYGNEFPFDPGHDEAAWAKNRRAQFMVTAK